jgi:glutathione S-transferase
MITLYTFGPAFGLADASPFVTKAHMLLKLAKRPYQTDSKGFGKAPKKKLPYISDDGVTVADSTFIRWHLEKKYGFDFDAGYSAEQRATAWCVEETLGEQLYFAMMYARWVDDDNFMRGPAHFFDDAPALLRPLIRKIVRGKVIKTLYSQGTSRHTDDEITQLARKTLDAVSTILGDKPYLLGDRPCGADATVFAFVASILSPAFKTPIRTAAERMPNLVGYVQRLRQEFFSDVEEISQ